jgi:hypothetical protein
MVLDARSLAAWLESRRLAAAAAARQAGLPPSIEASRLLVHFEDGGWKSETITQPVSSALLPPVTLGIRPVLDAEGERLARELHSRFGDGLIFFGLGPGALYGDASEDLLEEATTDRAFLCGLLTLRGAAISYLQQLSTLDEGAENAASVIAEEILAVSSSETIRSVRALPVAGVQLEEDFIVDGPTTIRRLTPEEAGTLVEQGNLFWRPEGLPVTRTYPFLEERVVIETATELPKAVAPNPPPLLKQLVLAAQLHGVHLAGVGWSFGWQEPWWLSSWATGGPISISPRVPPEAVVVSADDLSSWRELAAKIPATVFESARRTQERALKRFSLASGREAPADSLVDYVVALEAALLPGTREELRYRFQMNGSLLLSDKASDRLGFMHELRALYDLRSVLVHGGAPEPEPGRIAAAAERARFLAEQILHSCIRDHWPTLEEFNGWLLGE